MNPSLMFSRELSSLNVSSYVGLFPTTETALLTSILGDPYGKCCTKSWLIYCLAFKGFKTFIFRDKISGVFYRYTYRVVSLSSLITFFGLSNDWSSRFGWLKIDTFFIGNFWPRALANDSSNSSSVFRCNRIYSRILSHSEGKRCIHLFISEFC